MSKPLPDPPPGFEDLSIDDQIDYLQSLWDRIAAAADEVPVPEWHRAIIQRRLAELESNPNSAVPWEEARKEIAGRLNSR